MAAKKDQRTQTLRRQVNESFSDPNGRVSVTKIIAVLSQIAALFYFGRDFTALIDKPESLLIILTFLIAPDSIKKFLSMRYGAAK